jgi:hypothetical protein
VNASSVEDDAEFTLGVLDCPRCFVMPRRLNLVRDGKALRVWVSREEKEAASGKGKEIDIGVIVLE